MAIKGLTDQIRPTHLGMIRIGEKKQGQRGEYPAKLDHFIFDPKTEDEAEYNAILAKIREVYGDKPKSLRVRFASNDPRDIFDASYALWQASGCICKGDGATALRLDDRYVAMREENSQRAKTPTDPADIIEDEEMEGETFTRVVCRTPDLCPFAVARGQHGKPGCKANGLLRVVLPDLPGVGVWYIATGSINSIIRLNSAVQFLYGAFGGRLMGQEADLTVTPKNAIIPDTQKRTTVYVLDLTTKLSFNELRALPPVIQPAALIAADGDLVDTETGEVFEGAAPARPVADAPDADFRPALEDDPQVIAAFQRSGFSAAKQSAMIASAKQNGWDREKLIEVIGAHMNAAPPVTQSAPRPAPAPAHRTAAPVHRDEHPLPSGAPGRKPAPGRLF